MQSLAEHQEAVVDFAAALRSAEKQIAAAISLCESILSGTGPEGATAQERTLARSVLTALRLREDGYERTDNDDQR
jgi:hypothetical protein